MKKKLIVTGLILVMLLVPCLLVGCGMAQEQYNAMVAERDSTLAKLESVQGELHTTKLELDATQSKLELISNELETAQLELQLLRDQLSEAQAALASAPALAPAPAPLPTPAPTPAPAPVPAPTEVITTLDILWPILPKNWDADMEIDGIEFQLAPTDAEGRIVETPGVVSVKLWLERSLLEGKGKGDLVQEWSDIQVTKDDYHYYYLGLEATICPKIRLEYKDFQPNRMQFGILEVTFIIPDGKSFSTRVNSVLLGEL